MSDLEKHSGGCACGKVRYHRLVKCFTNNFTNKSINNRVTRLNIKYL